MKNRIKIWMDKYARLYKYSEGKVTSDQYQKSMEQMEEIIDMLLTEIQSGVYSKEE